ncbi:MAG: group II intron reverse transcriptase/maturase [Verrucomicrobiota bacterium]|nr:group II intron reverse transcriptase/maturase [Verrucomicrobiota bacterium]
MTEDGASLRKGSDGLPPRLAELREKLHEKAKQERSFRFYSLYGHLNRPVVLEAAWKQVRANKGAAGVDGVSIADVDRSEENVAAFLEDIRRDLAAKTYRPDRVRRVWIPKANGGLRPLGIPTVRDRVVQTALLLLLEPIFEADFMECSHGFRPGRNAHDALDRIGEALAQGQCSVYDADLAGYFDSIPHDGLIKCVRMRVTDGSVLRLLRAFLEAPVEDPPDEEGGPPKVRRNKRGTPQGGVISPLLANIYLHWFDKLFHRQAGPAHWAKATLVRYADDFVILARYIGPRLEGFVETTVEDWMGLSLNRDKTRIVDARQPGATVDFLGYSFRLEKDRYGRNCRYWRRFPSRKAMARERDRLREMTGPGQCFTPMDLLIERINKHLAGWANYFDKGHSRKEMRQINSFVRQRLTRHLQRRSQRGWRQPEGKSAYRHLADLGLIYL